MSRILSAPDLTDAFFAGQFHRIAGTAAQVDGYRPFNEQAMFDLASGSRTALLIAAEDVGLGAMGREEAIGGAVVGAAIVGAVIVGLGELDLVIQPASRGLGHARAALEEILVDAPAGLTAWSHGDHPAARALANRYGFESVRTLLQLCTALPFAGTTAAVDGPQQATSSASQQTSAGPATIEAFRPGIDDAEWVALNALVFADHPEQGSLTAVDLAARAAEPWFNPGDFLIARDRASLRMIGFNWLKIAGGSQSNDDNDSDDDVIGEIYVIGVHPDAAGQGLGRTLMLAGLERLRERGCTSAELYVEAESASAVHLYRSLGFIDRTVDVQYRRHPR